MPVTPVATADGDAAGHIQGREQGSDSVSFIIVRLARGHAGCERQNRLRAIQRLDLTLFVYAQDDRAIRWIQVQAHDVPHFLDELRVFGELKVLHSVRLQTKSAPNSHDGSL